MGLGLTGLFYLADLLMMHALPLFTISVDRMQLMTDLHLNYRWPVSLVSISAISVGLVLIIRGDVWAEPADSPARNSADGPPSPRLEPIVIVAVVGVAVSITAFLMMARQEQFEVEQRFAHETEAYANVMRNALVNAEEELDTIAGLFSTSGDVTAVEFDIFTTAILRRHPELRSLTWFPRVAAVDRDAFEQTVRRERNVDFRIRDVTAEGELVPAAESDEYFPALFSVPSDRPGIERTWGFNPISNERRRAAFETARDTGQRTATARIKLVSIAGDQFAVAIIQPIYENGAELDSVEARRAALAGYVTGAFQVGGLVETRLGDATARGLDIYIYDEAAGGEPEYLYYHASRTRSESVEPAPRGTLRAGLFSVWPLEVAGRSWSAVFKPAPGYFTAATWQAWMLLVGGLLLTATLVLYQRSVLLRNERVSHLVRQRTKALARVEDRLGGILENANDAVISVDSDQRIILFNQAAQRVFGYEPGEVLGRSLEMLLPPRFRAHHGGLVKGFAEGQVVSRSISERKPITGLRKDGGEFPAEASVSKLALGDQLIFTAMVRDVSKRRQAEEQLRQAQKMEAVGQLTGGVAHDFNNLLAIIEGYLSLLDESLHEAREISPAEVRKFIGPALRAGRRGAELTHRLLAFSRKQPLQPVALDVNKIVEGMEQLLKRTLGEDIDLRWHLGAGDWLAEVDASQLENAVLNLAVIARDAMPDGGRLTIETSDVTLDDDYARSRSEVKAGDYVMLAVSDTGTGMDADTLAQVFEPFFTTKEVGKGTGLGLSMVFGFVKQSGGHVAIYSEPGKGTTVRLYVPRAMGGETEAVEKVQESLSAGGHETILVVEDDEDVRDVATRMLQRLGYTVFAAKDGKTALIILESEGPFDLLLTDVVLPGGMSGPELATAVQEKATGGVNVLYMSGYTENAIFHHGRLDQGVNLIGKPFSYASLGAKVREALDSAS